MANPIRAILMFVLHNICWVHTQAVISVNELPCNFELDSCEWGLTNLDRTKYGSKYKQTGPTKAYNGDYYVFLNPENKNFGETGSLDSPELEASTNVAPCMVFWYHMYGEFMGSLQVHLTSSNGNKSILWKKEGDQGSDWHCTAVNIAGAKKYWIGIEAVMGSLTYSMIAIDDIKVMYGVNCQEDNCANLASITKTPFHESSTKTTTTTFSTSETSTQSDQLPGTTEIISSSFDEYIPYIAGVPAAVLVICVIVVIGCYIRSKRHNKEDGEPFEHTGIDNDYLTTVEENPYDHLRSPEEVYHEIDKPSDRDAQLNAMVSRRKMSNADSNISGGHVNQGLMPDSMNKSYDRDNERPLPQLPRDYDDIGNVESTGKDRVHPLRETQTDDDDDGYIKPNESSDRQRKYRETDANINNDNDYMIPVRNTIKQNNYPSRNNDKHEDLGYEKPVLRQASMTTTETKRL